MVYIRPDGVIEMVNVEKFIANSIKLIRKNKIKDFNEKEISRMTEVFGRIAHAFSTYESRFSESDLKPFGRGLNSIQLLNDKGRWWVFTVFWADERAEGPIPAEYLS